MKIIFVVATRLTYEAFTKDAALAKSLAMYDSENIEIVLYPENTHGLPRVYNHAMGNLGAQDDIVIFCHDDIYLLDFYWIDNLIVGLERFDIVGLAGNRTRVKNQPSWLFKDAALKDIDFASLSGMVAHGKSLPPTSLSIYGPPLQEVELLDGVFLACRAGLLAKHQLRFDELFEFDFYDLDFCRTARQKGLRLGTLMTSVMHESAGNFGISAWQKAMANYLLKWGD